MLGALDARFAEDKGWSEKRPVLEKWTPGLKDGDVRGCWTPPGRFEWVAEGEESVGERTWREELVKRRVSGSFWRDAVGNGRVNGVNGNRNGVLASVGSE